MKQRFSSLDVKVLAHELNQSLVTLRLSNIYDLSSKILLLKFQKPDNKKQLVIESGFRCHLTDFARTTANAPSAFVARLRKFLKTRRLTGVAQIGTDRILEFKFSDGAYRLYLEFFASGNIILTDGELKILTLLRIVPEGEGQEPQKVGATYSLENRQNYRGVPDFTDDRLRVALRSIADKANVAPKPDQKMKKKAKDELRRGLSVNMSEFPPLLVEHALRRSEFDTSTKAADVLENETTFESLFKALQDARKLVDEITSTEKCPGYIIAKKRPAKAGEAEAPTAEQASNLLYDDFHPFSPSQYENDPLYTILKFDNFNKTVDEFFSSIEGQKLESRLTEREETAKRRLEQTKAEHTKRLDGLQEVQDLNVRKASAIEANLDWVQEAMDAVSGLVEQGMDWVNIDKLIEREQERQNPVAEIIKLPLNLAESTITLLLGEEVFEPEDEDIGYETASSVSDEDDDREEDKSKTKDTRLAVNINLTMSPWANARSYFDNKKTAAAKQVRTAAQSAVALKSAEQKILADLKKGLKQEKVVLQPIRRIMWYEKFHWFISSEGHLVLGGRDAQQNEILYKRYLKKGDVYVHAELQGAPSVIVKNNPKTPDAPIPPQTLAQAGTLAVCATAAWESKAQMGAYWVNADQVSKSAPTGEFLPTGSFMVRGKKNFLHPAQLLLGFGLLFRVSDESRARHAKKRGVVSVDEDEGTQEPAEDIPERDLETPALTVGSTADTVDTADNDEESDSEDEHQDDEDELSRKLNPLQLNEPQADFGKDDAIEADEPTTDGKDDTTQTETKPFPGTLPTSEAHDELHPNEDPASEAESTYTPSIAPSTTSTMATKTKQQPLKRGQRSKAKKIAAKYKDQDDEDRRAAEALIGASAGRARAEAEAQARAERAAQAEADRERRKAQHERQQAATRAHEAARLAAAEDDTADTDGTELEPLEYLVAAPLPGDELLEVVPVCAPYSAMSRCKYKAKLQPGGDKKGKAVKSVLERWKADSDIKGALDEKSEDVEKMWPREVELIRGMKVEEAVNAVWVGKVKVMIAGGAGGGSKGGGGAGNKGKGGKGAGGGGGKGGGKGKKK